MLKNIDGILELIDYEFGEMIEKGKFRSFDDVELVYKYMDIVKDAYCAMSYEHGMGDTYSQDGDWHEKMPEKKDWYSGNTVSHNWRSGKGKMPHDYRGRSFNYSRADAVHEFVENLRDLIDTAPDDRSRDCIQKMINELET